MGDKMSEAVFNDENFKAEVLERKGITIVDFWAPWCGPCRVMGPIFEEAANEDKKAHWGKLNVDEAQKTAQNYGVMSIPTIILFKDGKKVEQLTGVQDKETLVAKVKEHSDA